jgi:hypothetical protein
MMRMTTVVSFAKRAAVTVVATGAVLGCSNDVQTSQSGAEPTDTSAQELSHGERHRGHPSDPPADPPSDPPSASDCGATDAAPCRVTSALTGMRFGDLRRPSMRRRTATCSR